MKKKRSSSVFFKITVLFTAALVMAMTSLVVFNTLYFKSATLDMFERIRSQSDLSLELSVESKLNEYAKIMYRMVTDKNIRDYFKGYDDPENGALAAHKLRSWMETYSSADIDIIALSMFNQERKAVVYDRTPDEIRNLLWAEYRASGALDSMAERAQESKKVMFLAEPRRVNGRSVIHIVFSIWDYYTLKDMGMLVVTVDATSLWRLIGSTAAEKEAVVFLVQRDGRIMAHPDYQMIGMPATGYVFDADSMSLTPDSVAEGERPLFDRRAEISVKKLQAFDIYMVSVLEPGIYAAGISRYIRLAALMAILISSVFVLVYLNILRGLLSSIKAVIAGIEKVRDGNLDVTIEIPPRDEIYYIAEALNSTLQSLNTISRERDQEFLRFLRESERRRIAEVRSLQSQINSHFLYNTLNMINYVALEGDIQKTSNMIKSLADCLRYTLNKNCEVVRIADETNWLEKYLLLQKERQPSLFDYNITVSSDTMALPIQKLIIQPFVENAIVHGFAGKKSGGLLEITIRMIKNPARIAIAIYDNGTGLSESKLAEIKNLLYNYTSADGLGIGIENACFRINTHYQSNAKIFVRSRANNGTRFNIVLPVNGAEQ